jgi:hypothetical protein
VLDLVQTEIENGIPAERKLRKKYQKLHKKLIFL